MMFLTSCDQPQDSVRHYEEISILPKSGSVSSGNRQSSETRVDPAPAVKFLWDAPETWVERKGTGMRLVTFEVPSNEEKVECTIIAFPGDVGGVEANIKRWMGQLDLNVSAPDLNQFISEAMRFQTLGGFEGTYYDFAPLLGVEGHRSMLVSIVEVPGKRVFIKMAGSKVLLAASKGAFLALCHSLRMAGLKEEPRS